MPTVICAAYFAVFLGFAVTLVVGVLGFIYLANEKPKSLDGWFSNKKLLIVSVLALALGCGTFLLVGNSWTASYYPPAPRWKPNTVDIIGVWHLTDVSLDVVRVASETNKLHEIELKEDGSFLLRDYPEFISYADEWKFISASGTWTIDKNISRDWVVRIQIEEQNEFETSGYLYLVHRNLNKLGILTNPVE